MTFTEYFNQENPTKQANGSVILKREEYTTFFRIQREPRTDKKYNQLYITLEVGQRQFTYKVTEPLLILFDGLKNKPSVFSIRKEDFEAIKKEHQNEIITEVSKYL